MKRKVIFSIFIASISLPASADDLWDIVTLLARINGYEQQILTTQQDIESLNREIKQNLTSHSGWGNYQIKNYQSYGADANTWSNVLHLSKMGGGNSELGQTIKPLAQEFPINTNLINQTTENPLIQKQYALQAQTVLATRAASALDYNKIQDQIVYQQMLRDQIEKTTDIKAAMDLANRIHVENNLIQLQTLRQIALANQQQAVATQGELNSAVLNANFLK